MQGQRIHMVSQAIDYIEEHLNCRVEMECAAALAVTQFRKISFVQFLYGADNLDSPRWEPRDLTEYGLSAAEKYMVLAFECAIVL